MKRDALLRELKKGGITRKTNAAAIDVQRLVNYGSKAGKEYTELHIADETFRALINDKLRMLADMPRPTHFRHPRGEDAPRYYDIRLLPMNPELLGDYARAALPAE